VEDLAGDDEAIRRRLGLQLKNSQLTPPGAERGMARLSHQRCSLSLSLPHRNQASAGALLRQLDPWRFFLGSLAVATHRPPCPVGPRILPAEGGERKSWRRDGATRIHGTAADNVRSVFFVASQRKIMPAMLSSTEWGGKMSLLYLRYVSLPRVRVIYYLNPNPNPDLSR
jgi:hypothetical protein